MLLSLPCIFYLFVPLSGSRWSHPPPPVCHCFHCFIPLLILGSDPYVKTIFYDPLLCCLLHDQLLPNRLTSSMKTEALYSPETLVAVYETTGHHIPEDHNIDRCENLEVSPAVISVFKMLIHRHEWNITVMSKLILLTVKFLINKTQSYQCPARMFYMK